MLQMTLSEAIKTHRLQEFIAQEEDRGVPAASLKEFQDLAARLIKDTPQEDQTSRSRAVVRTESKFPQILVEVKSHAELYWSYP